MRLYSGLDLHSNNTVVGILDETGKPVLKKRVRNDVSLIDGVLRPHREDLAAVVVESTFNWYWLVDGLMDLGYPMLLAHPAANSAYSGVKYSDDRDSALWLAELARMGGLRQGYIYPRAQRGVRDLLRQRTRLVRSRTGHILSIKNIIARENGPVLRAAAVEALTEESIGQVVRGEFAQIAVFGLTRVIAELGRQIQTMERTVLEQVRPDPRWRRLETVWGVGEILGLVIHLETGEMKRFAGVKDYVSYARCVDSKRLSNGKLIGKNNKRNGNPYLEWAFVEAAHYASIHYLAAERFLARKKAKTNGIVARKTLAAKLSRAAYYVMRDEVEFDPEKLFRS